MPVAPHPRTPTRTPIHPCWRPPSSLHCTSTNTVSPARGVVSHSPIHSFIHSCPFNPPPPHTLPYFPHTLPLCLASSPCHSLLLPLKWHAKCFTRRQTIKVSHFAPFPFAFFRRLSLTLVAGGRSRLHIIDLGGCANRNGGLPLSGIGNILLAILSGQRHPPHKDHPLTPLLKDCLAPITCHVAIIAHIQHSQSYQDALSTIQIASRIHRLRRRKHRNPLPLAVGLAQGLQGGAGSSTGSGADPSSSEISADTVIYMGPHDDGATDGEHPPIYLPSLNSSSPLLGSKALKASSTVTAQPVPQPKSNCASPLMKKAALEKGK